MAEAQPCPVCKGSGHISFTSDAKNWVYEPCYGCLGEGWVVVSTSEDEPDMMPPRKRYIIELEVKSIKKAEPRIVEPEGV